MKLAVKPTVLQATLLKGLSEFDGMTVNDKAGKRGRWYSLTGGYGDELKTQRLYGVPRPATVRSCLAEGWLELAPGVSAFYERYVLSEAGRLIATTLTDDDLRIAPKLAITSETVLQALKVRHPFPAWLFAVEVRMATGFGKSYYIKGHPATIGGDQRIDAFAMHTWPSKKFVRIAYEVKVSRQDFLNELRHPDKRLAAELFANLTYFAAPDGLIKPTELPDGWGLVEINGDMTTTRLEPIRREVDRSMPIEFVASLGRSLMVA